MRSPDLQYATSLRQLAADMVRMADEIEARNPGQPLDEAGTRQRVRPVSNSLLESETELLLNHAIQLYRFRLKRANHFDADIFGEPAWDMLLDLFIARLQRRKISVTSACVASNVSLTTGLRWLSLLEERGHVVRSESVSDRRVTWVRLSDRSTSAMSALLRESVTTPESRDGFLSAYVLSDLGS